jgi:hypothetical protein
MLEVKITGGPGWKGLEEHEVAELREYADSIHPCDAMSVDNAINWVTRPPEGRIWNSPLLLPMRPPADWERIILDHWPPLVKKKITPDRAIGVLQLEIKERYAPRAAEEEWNRRNAPRKSRWKRERRRIVSILERRGRPLNVAKP